MFAGLVFGVPLLGGIRAAPKQFSTQNPPHGETLLQFLQNFRIDIIRSYFLLQRAR
jgi:hypothetical protein